MNASSDTSPQSFQADLVVTSPGRINFIGGHTDYNQGFVLPTAIDKKIIFDFKINGTDSGGKVFSSNYGTVFKFNLNNIQASGNEWENYILGVVHGLQEHSADTRNKLKGFDCNLRSEVPIGAGVSSSAALECGIAFGLNELFELGLDRLSLAKIAQRAEHEYVGTKCGIMDQFASLMSERNKVILLDCRTNTYDLIDAKLDPYEILLLNTNVSHNLATSDYNTRREECEAAVQVIHQAFPLVQSLRDVSHEQLEKCRAELSETEYKRASFIIAENTRVQTAAAYLADNKLIEFGQLIYQSHHGLQNLYEVSCPELDFLVEYSHDRDYIIASRMMGGGFGGCTLNLIHQDHTESYIEEIKAAYFETFNIKLSTFVTTPSQGTSLVKRATKQS